MCRHSIKSFLPLMLHMWEKIPGPPRSSCNRKQHGPGNEARLYSVFPLKNMVLYFWHHWYQWDTNDTTYTAELLTPMNNNNIQFITRLTITYHTQLWNGISLSSGAWATTIYMSHGERYTMRCIITCLKGCVYVHNVVRFLNGKCYGKYTAALCYSECTVKFSFTEKQQGLEAE